MPWKNIKITLGKPGAQESKAGFYCAVSISAEGRVVAYELARLSGTGMLDDATQKLGKRLIGLDVPPAKGKAVTFVVPVQYILTK